MGVLASEAPSGQMQGPKTAGRSEAKAMLTGVSVNTTAHVWAVSAPTQPAGHQAGCLTHGAWGLQCGLFCEPCPLMTAQA